jgi:hypothetical protein
MMRRFTLPSGNFQESPSIPMYIYRRSAWNADLLWAKSLTAQEQENHCFIAPWKKSGKTHFFPKRLLEIGGHIRI